MKSKIIVTIACIVIAINLPAQSTALGYIIDEENSINSLEDLAGHLEGKPLFIDCWATWCAPCFEEFKHNEELTQFLKSKNIDMVYINFDGNIDEGKWLQDPTLYMFISEFYV